MTRQEKDFIKTHLHADVSKLILNPSAEHRERIKFLAGQILSRQKARTKLPQWYVNFELEFPAPISVEQASSGLTASYKTEILRGDILVDLTGGMGVDCLALSNNFGLANYVESNPELCRTFRQNAETLGASISVHNQTSENFLKESSLSSACFFIDPARRDEHAGKVFKFSDCSPDVSALLPAIREKGNQLLIKAAPLIDLKQGLTELGGASEIHVVSVRNECKEVLFYIDFEKSATHDPLIRTVNFLEDGKEVFDFRFSEELDSEIDYGGEGDYLLLPNASILKAGAFRRMAMNFNIRKISANTHLYFSDEPIENFPGRQFRITNHRPTSRELKGQKLSVITRNYPLSADQLSEKLKIKNGGKNYLIAYRDQVDKPQLKRCELLKPANFK